MSTHNQIKIGGEFELNPEILNGVYNFTPKKNTQIASNGRVALRIILEHLNKNEGYIHLPYYICSSVIDSCIASGYQPLFYEINDDFTFPEEYIDTIEYGGILLTINYFGFVNDNPTIYRIKEERPDITIISDQVQSYWMYKKSIADFSFTSLRKHFPVIEGGPIYSRKNIKLSIDNSQEFSEAFKSKLIGSILKYNKLDDNLYLKFLESGEKEYNKNRTISGASIIAKYLFESLDEESCKKRRNDNYRITYDIGNQYHINFLFPYDKDITPMCIPILIPNRDKIRKQLSENNIFLPIHWPMNQHTKSSKIANKISPNIISLVIDQRYSKNEIEIEIMTLINILRNDK